MFTANQPSEGRLGLFLLPIFNMAYLCLFALPLEGRACFLKAVTKR